MLLDLILQVLEKDWDQLSPEEITLIRDETHYLAEFENTITELERGLHSMDDPKRIAGSAGICPSRGTAFHGMTNTR